MLLSKIRFASSGAFTKNFALVFLELGVPRLPPAAKARLALEILQGIGEGEGASAPYGRQQVALVHRLLEVMEHIQPMGSAPTSEQQQQDVNQMSSTSSSSAEAPSLTSAGFLPPPTPSTTDISFLLDLFLDILLIPNATKLKPSTPAQGGGTTPAPPIGLIPGLSHESLQRIASHPTFWTSNGQATLAKVC